ncbi:protein translocase subunit SecF [Nocardioides sp.]|jgi:preprotein translocase subunit SecF|uniref:protein translocase subunit SecF n=1 Tax=Nocardioides sp. TaxID=35761 RepID=UPI002B68402D|nr:protein translocase subunit SecF [Nocardioides sp.]HVX54480.1 protein translocase subunit SecF [Nocardioides sp.]
MSKFTRLGNSLYTGEKSIDFVGRKWTWYAISAVIIIAAILGLSLKGLNMGLEFTGGTQYTVTVSGTASQKVADSVRTAVGGSGVKAASDPTVTTSGAHNLIIQIKSVSQAENTTVLKAITDTTHVSAKNVSQDHVGASWGKEVATKAIQGLVVFLVAVMLFIAMYTRQWKMSVAALVALAHDVVITVGVYALSGFEVTPATVTGFLTILGFSLYDTVVVFDKIKENTKNLRATKRSYADAANLAVNQTLVRSINTSIVALIPVAAILWVSAVQLGTSTLKDLALALFVGMAAGTYSSIFIATPLFVQLKSGEKEVLDAERRARRARQADPYANVPAFVEGMEVEDDGIPAELREGEETTAPHGFRTRPNTDAMGRGRTAPPARGPVRESGSSGRRQPTRQPRSKRGK